MGINSYKLLKNGLNANREQLKNKKGIEAVSSI